MKVTLGKLLSIGFQPRMDKNMKMIRKIQSCELGKAYYIQTRGERRHGIPNITTIHHFHAKETRVFLVRVIGLHTVLYVNLTDEEKYITITGEMNGRL